MTTLPPSSPEHPFTENLGVAYTQISNALHGRAFMDKNHGWILDGVPVRFFQVMEEVNRVRKGRGQGVIKGWEDRA